MRIKATVTKGEFIQGNEYELPPAIATAMIIAGTAEVVTVAYSPNREKAILLKYETR